MPIGFAGGGGSRRIMSSSPPRATHFGEVGTIWEDLRGGATIIRLYCMKTYIFKNKNKTVKGTMVVETWERLEG